MVCRTEMCLTDMFDDSDTKIRRFLKHTQHRVCVCVCVSGHKFGIGVWRLTGMCLTICLAEVCLTEMLHDLTTKRC